MTLRCMFVYVSVYECLCNTTITTIFEPFFCGRIRELLQLINTNHYYTINHPKHRHDSPMCVLIYQMTWLAVVVVKKSVTASYTTNVMAALGATRRAFGILPLKKPNIPSFFHILTIQSTTPL